MLFREAQKGEKTTMSWAIYKDFTKEVDLKWSLKGMMIMIVIANVY